MAKPPKKKKKASYEARFLELEEEKLMVMRKMLDVLTDISLKL